jgi:hypothetical protein
LISPLLIRKVISVEATIIEKLPNSSDNNIENTTSEEKSNESSNYTAALPSSPSSSSSSSRFRKDDNKLPMRLVIKQLPHAVQLFKEDSQLRYATILYYMNFFVLILLFFFTDFFCF